ncbi:MAG: hypothetical protein GY750_03575 [Lentisphaerae bacterium]|nr:hypothetical protein [Lentisphaerota bacterium]MCP4100498.1 hypothetical protein [Lentisphaerota bacterium]
MSIRFRCNNCNQKYELDDDLAGKKVLCMNCMNSIVVPGKSTISPHKNSNRSQKRNSQDSKIRFWCKKCGQKYRLGREFAGKNANCNKCGSTLPVPYESEDGPLQKFSQQSPPRRSKSSDKIKFSCKVCSQKYRLGKEFAGKNANCNKCGSTLPVPYESEVDPAIKARAQSGIYNRYEPSDHEEKI